MKKGIRKNAIEIINGILYNLVLQKIGSYIDRNAGEFIAPVLAEIQWRNGAFTGADERGCITDVSEFDIHNQSAFCSTDC